MPILRRGILIARYTLIISKFPVPAVSYLRIIAWRKWIFHDYIFYEWIISMYQTVGEYLLSMDSSLS